jgi:hypothetical protein
MRIVRAQGTFIVRLYSLLIFIYAGPLVRNSPILDFATQRIKIGSFHRTSSRVSYGKYFFAPCFGAKKYKKKLFPPPAGQSIVRLKTGSYPIFFAKLKIKCI